MKNRQYYAERKDLIFPEQMDFQLLKDCFLHVFKDLRVNLYFLEATGYNCTEFSDQRGLWGLGDRDYQTFFYMKMKMTHIWPIEKNIDEYDQATLFSVIEFLYDYVSQPIEKWYHDYGKCGWHCNDFDQGRGKIVYSERINELLLNYETGYYITEKGEIYETPPTGFERIIKKKIKTDDPENIDSIVQLAISKFSKHDATLNDKKEAVRTLGDVIEYLRKGNLIFNQKDDKELFDILRRMGQILNYFSIRHHNSSQKTAYLKELWFPWMFYFFLATTHLLANYKIGKNAV